MRAHVRPAATYLATCVKRVVVALAALAVAFAPIGVAFALSPPQPVQGVKLLGTAGGVTGLGTSIATAAKFVPWGPLNLVVGVVTIMTGLGEIGVVPVDPTTDTQPAAVVDPPYAPTTGYAWYVSSSANSVYEGFGYGLGYSSHTALCSAIGGTITYDYGNGIHYNCGASNGNNVIERYNGQTCASGGTLVNGQCVDTSQQQCPTGWAVSLGGVCYKPWANPGFNGPVYAVDPADGQLKPHPNAPGNASTPSGAPATVGVIDLSGVDVNGTPVRQRITPKPGGGVTVEQWVEATTPGGNKETERQKIDVGPNGQTNGQERTVSPGSIEVNVAPPSINIELPTDYAREATQQAGNTTLTQIKQKLDSGIKVDETGTPSAAEFSAVTTKIEQTKTAGEGLITTAGGDTGKEAASWNWLPTVPTTCTPYVLSAAGTRLAGLSVDLCAFQSQIHDVMNLIWAGGTLFAIYGMVGRSIRGG